MRKRLLSLALCLCMTLSLLPTAALAATSYDSWEAATAENVTLAKGEDTITIGGVTYTYKDDATTAGASLITGGPSDQAPLDGNLIWKAGDGYILYSHTTDASTAAVTLHSAESAGGIYLPCSGTYDADKEGMVYTGVDTTVTLEGTSTLSDALNHAAGSTTFTGSTGTLNLTAWFQLDGPVFIEGGAQVTLGAGTEQSCIFNNTLTVKSGGALTVADKMTLMSGSSSNPTANPGGITVEDGGTLENNGVIRMVTKEENVSNIPGGITGSGVVCFGTSNDATPYINAGGTWTACAAEDVAAGKVTIDGVTYIKFSGAWVTEGDTVTIGDKPYTYKGDATKRVGDDVTLNFAPEVSSNGGWKPLEGDLVWKAGDGYILYSYFGTGAAAVTLHDATSAKIIGLPYSRGAGAMGSATGCDTTVTLEGTSTLSGYLSHAAGSTTFAGSGTLNLTQNMACLLEGPVTIENGAHVTVGNGDGSQTGYFYQPLTVKSGSTLTVAASATLYSGNSSNPSDQPGGVTVENGGALVNNGTLRMAAKTAANPGITGEITGSGVVHFASDTTTPYIKVGTEWLADGGDKTSAALDLSTAPTARTLYTAGSGTILWEPTTATLTFNGVTMNVENNDGSATAVTLPSNAKVVFTGSNSITASGSSMKSAYAFKCTGNATFELKDGNTTLTLNNAKDTYGINASGAVTVNNSGTLTIDSNGQVTQNTISARGQAVTLNGGTMAFKGDDGIAAGTITLGGITVPAGATLSMHESGSSATVLYGADSTINGELIMPYQRPYTASDFTHFTGSGTVKVDDTTYKMFGTEWVAYGGEVPEGGLDLSVLPPTVKTVYKAGTGTIIWNPTLDNNNVVSSGKLTLDGAKINFSEGANPASAITLPSVPVTVELVGKSEITGLSNQPVFSSSSNVTLTGSGYIVANTSGYFIETDGAVTLNDGSPTGKIWAPVGITLGSITIPEGGELDLSAVTTVTQTANTIVTNNGALKLPASADPNTLSLAGSGSVMVGDKTMAKLGGAWVAIGGDASSTSLDLSGENTPTVSTVYKAGSDIANNYIVFTPKSGNTPATLTLNNADAKSITLPSGPCKLVLKGKSITGTIKVANYAANDKSTLDISADADATLYASEMAAYSISGDITALNTNASTNDVYTFYGVRVCNSETTSTSSIPVVVAAGATLNVEATMTFKRSSAFTNNGKIQITAGGTLDLSGCGSVTGANGSIANAGTLELPATADPNALNITGSGTLTVDGITLIYENGMWMQDVSTSGLELGGGLPSANTTYKAGNGTIEFTPAGENTPATLTLKNAVIDLSDNGDPVAAIRLPQADFALVLEGVSTLTAVGGNDQNGISFANGAKEMNSSLTVSGTGTLNITAAFCAITDANKDTINTFTVNSGTLNLTPNCKNGFVGEAVGLSANIVALNGGTVNITSGKYLIPTDVRQMTGGFFEGMNEETKNFFVTQFGGQTYTTTGISATKSFTVKSGAKLTSNGLVSTASFAADAGAAVSALVTTGDLMSLRLLPYGAVTLDATPLIMTMMTASFSVDTANGSLTIPAGLTLNALGGVTTGQQITVNGTLALPATADPNALNITGSGKVMLGEKALSRVNGVWVLDVTTTGLDLSSPNTPTFKTTYKAGEGSVVWEPTPGDGNTVTGGKLTLSGAAFDIPDNIPSNSVIMLPNVPVTVELAGANSITLPPASSRDTFYSGGRDVTLTGSGSIVAKTSGYLINAQDGAVTLEGGYIAGRIKAGSVTLGGVTFEMLDLRDVAGGVTKGTAGAVNNVTLLMPAGTTSEQIAALGLTGSGMVQAMEDKPDNPKTLYFKNDGTPITTDDKGHDFAKMEDDGNWSKEATLEKDGYSITGSLDEGYTLTLGDIIVAPADTSNPVPINLPEWKVELVLTGEVVRLDASDSQLDEYTNALNIGATPKPATASISAVRPVPVAGVGVNYSTSGGDSCTISGSGKLEAISRPMGSGIYTYIPLTIAGGDITATGGRYGIYANGDSTLTITGGALTVYGTAGAFNKAPTFGAGYTPKVTAGDSVLTATVIANPTEETYTESKYVKIERAASPSGGAVSYTLTFETNGGSAIDKVTEAGGTAIDLAAYVPAKTGYIFAGWYADAQFTDKVASVELTGDMTVYAKWLTFEDVREDDWFYEDIKYVVEKGLMGGTGDTAFDPEAATTRGMIVTILYRLEGQPAVTGGCPFDDVESGKYYENAITWAAANSVVGGYGDGRFGPEDNITREQLAAILYRYAKYKGCDVSGSAELSKFTDAGSVSAYAVPALQWAISSGLMDGKGNGILDPQGSAKRCEAAAILHRFCEKTAM